MNEQRRITVLVIDDSALMRQLLTAMLQEDPGIEVIGTAANPLIARERIKRLRPDVLTLDVEMPGMDGITFLEKLMRLYPLPVVMVSSVTERGAATTLRALELGAVDFVTKPRGGKREGIEEIAQELRAKIHTAARAHVRAPLAGGPVRAPARPPRHNAVVLLGASAGGPQAIAQVLGALPAQTPPIAIAQHMPARFTRLFAERLARQCAIEVREARNGDRLHPGLALIAPGGMQMALARAIEGFYIKIFNGDAVSRHHPSVNVLFDSAARCAGRDALGVILTGMGNDGAEGMYAMKQAGAYTMAQDEASSVVFGMPEQAIRLGGVCEIVPLAKIAERMLQWAAPGSDTGADRCSLPDELR